MQFRIGTGCSKKIEIKSKYISNKRDIANMDKSVFYYCLSCILLMTTIFVFTDKIDKLEKRIEVLEKNRIDYITDITDIIIATVFENAEELLAYILSDPNHTK